MQETLNLQHTYGIPEACWSESTTTWQSPRFWSRNVLVAQCWQRESWTPYWRVALLLLDPFVADRCRWAKKRSKRVALSREADRGTVGHARMRACARRLMIGCCLAIDAVSVHQHVMCIMTIPLFWLDPGVFVDEDRTRGFQMKKKLNSVIVIESINILSVVIKH